MKYMVGKEEKGVGTVAELFIDELGRLAGLTESRRWYAGRFFFFFFFVFFFFFGFWLLVFGFGFLVFGFGFRFGSSARFALSDFFLGGCLGVGIQALSSMSVLQSLPDLNIPKV
jgi:hypothetical protein